MKLQSFDKVSISNPHHHHEKYRNLTGVVHDVSDFSANVDLGSRSPKNNRGRAIFVRFGLEELTFMQRVCVKPKALHQGQSYNGFSLQTWDALGGGIQVLAFLWSDPEVRFTEKFDTNDPRQALKEMIALVNKINPLDQQTFENADDKKMNNHYSISAIRREWNGRHIYSASVPFPFVAQMLKFHDPSLPPEERAQRQVDVAHAKRIKGYILSTPQYYLPPLILAVLGGSRFMPFKGDANNGILEVLLNAQCIILDGQHRCWAIREICSDPELAVRFSDEHISVDMIANIDLATCQRLFRTVNANVKPVSKNLTAIYNDDPKAIAINSIISQVPAFGNQFVEKEKVSLGVKSSKVFVYKHLFDATKTMIGDTHPDITKEYCVKFWQALNELIPEWSNDALKRRETGICCYGITLVAFGLLGSYLMPTWGNQPELLVGKMRAIAQIDWSKSNPDWRDRVVDEQGKMLTKRHNAKLLLTYLKVKIGVPAKTFSVEEKSLEQEWIGNLDLFS